MGAGTVDRKESKRWVTSHQTSYDGGDWGEGYDDEYGTTLADSPVDSPGRETHASAKGLDVLEEEEEPKEEKLEEEKEPVADEPTGPTTAGSLTDEITKRFNKGKEEATAPEAAVEPVSKADTDPAPAKSHAIEMPPPNKTDKAASANETDEVPGSASSSTISQSAEQSTIKMAPQRGLSKRTLSTARKPVGSGVSRSNSTVSQAIGESSAHEETADTSHNTSSLASVSESSRHVSSQSADIHDIYGIYEDRVGHHPYSSLLSGGTATGASASGEYSDSTASLSTGHHSVESSAFDGGARSSMDYQPSLHRVPEGKEADAENTAEDLPSATPIISHEPEQDQEREPESELEPEPEAEHYTSYTPGTNENDHHAVGLGVGVSDSEESESDMPESLIRQKTLESEILSNFKNTEEQPPVQPSLRAGHSRGPSAASSSAGPDPELAELYEGTSEFLKRPISVYQDNVQPLQMRHAISDAEIRALLTPSMQQDEFDDDLPTPTLATGTIPELHVSNAGNDEDVNSPVSAESDAADSNDSYSTGAHEGKAKAVSLPPLRLPSELNRDAQPDSPESPAKQFDGYVDTEDHMYHVDDEDQDEDEEDGDDSGSEFSNGHAHKTSDFSGISAGTAVSGVSGVSSEEDRDPQSLQGSGSVGSSEKPRNVLAGKVKRPPPVDFAALFNNPSGSSESRIEQLRTLRIREAEYSSGLETWLVEIYARADKGMNIYTTGKPPSQPAPHEGAGAKVTNAMHESTSMAKEKLGRVGEKSRSFFAKGRKKLIK